MAVPISYNVRNVRQRWQVYEEMAGRAAEHFPADGRAVPAGARPAAASPA